MKKNRVYSVVLIMLASCICPQPLAAMSKKRKHYFEHSQNKKEKRDTVGLSKHLLHELKHDNNITKIKDLLLRGADADFADEAGDTAFHSCAYKGTLETFLLLLSSSKTKKFSSYNHEKILPIYYAIQENNTAIANAILTKKPELLEHKMPITAGRTLLQFAAQNKTADMVQLLLSHMHKHNRLNLVDATDDAGCTALHIAAMTGNKKTVELLLLYGATLDAQDKGGSTPLFYAIKDKRLEAIQFLLEKKAYAKIKNFNQQTALHCAARAKSLDILTLLIKKDLPIDAQDKDGQTPLHYAASSGSATCLQELIKKGADIEQEDFEGATPLSLAAKNGHLNCVKLLLHCAADIKARTNEGTTVLQGACLHKENGPLITYLLDHGAPIDATDNDNYTALMYAAQNDFADNIKILLERGATKDLQDNEGLTALHHASTHGCCHAARVLIEYRSSLLATDTLGWTPLHCAVFEEKIETVRLLLEKGAPVNQRDGSGYTALHTAAKNDYLAIVKLLISRGADHILVNNDGQTVLDIANNGSATKNWLITFQTYHRKLIPQRRERKDIQNSKTQTLYQEIRTYLKTNNEQAALVLQNIFYTNKEWYKTILLHAFESDHNSRKHTLKAIGNKDLITYDTPHPRLHKKKNHIQSSECFFVFPV